MSGEPETPAIPVREILELIERQSGVLRRRQIAEKLGLPEERYRDLCLVLDELESQGLIIAGRGSRYRLPGTESVVGRLDVKRGGFGFVVPVRGASHDVYVPADAIGEAMDGDLVLAEVGREGRRSGRGPAAGRLRVIERARSRVVGMFAADSRGGGAVLPDSRALSEIEIPPGESAEATLGEKVIAEITSFPRGGRPARGRIVERLGESGTLESETRAVIEAHNLRDEFPPEATAQAEKADGEVTDRDRLSRADYTAEPAVTIDPSDAADFDDAVTLLAAGEGRWTLRVHIADVSFYVPEGSPVDKEARLRGTSCYLPGHVIPMLPRRLTREVCCLREGETKRVKTVTMTLDATGRRLDGKIERALFRSSKRLDYDRVHDAVESGAPGDIPPQVFEMLKQMKELSQTMRRRRVEAGSIDLEIPEPRVVFEDGHISAIEPHRHTWSNELIEEFMLAANVAVARALQTLELDGLFRVHEDPDDDALEEFAEFVRGAGGRLGRPYTRENLQKALRHFRGTPDETAINIAFLQSMKQARYSETCRPHWALAFNDYCHFTSPIRRYPDLVVHRALDGAFEPGRPALVKTRADLSQGGSLTRRDRLHRLAHLAETCSTTERRAEKAERQLTEFCEMFLLSSRLGDVRKGIVTAVERYGIFIDIEGLTSRGLVHVSELPGSGYKFSPKRSALVESRKGGRTYAFGQEVRVRVTQVDLVGKRLVLSLVE